MIKAQEHFRAKATENQPLQHALTDHTSAIQMKKGTEAPASSAATESYTHNLAREKTAHSVWGPRAVSLVLSIRQNDAATTLTPPFPAANLVQDFTRPPYAHVGYLA